MSFSEESSESKEQILQKRFQQFGNIQGTGTGRSDLDLMDKLKKLQFLSRRNYLLLFSDNLSKSGFKFDEVLRAITAEQTDFRSMIKDPSTYQSISDAIFRMYDVAPAFADAIYEYFKKPENSSDLALFTYITFPAIYGFFIAEDQLPQAYELISLLLNKVVNCNDNSFALNFIAPFYFSAHQFLDAFFSIFFDEISSLNFTPSLAKVLLIFKDALGKSVLYFSPLHNKMNLELSFQMPNQFFKIFFLDFLLVAFDSWILMNPGFTRTKISHNTMQNLFKHLLREIEGPDMKNITDLLKKPMVNSLVSFTQHFQTRKILCFLSPREVRILTKLFYSIESLRDLIAPETLRKIESKEFDNLSGGLLEFYLKKQRDKDINHPDLIFPSDTPWPKPDSDEDTTRICRRIKELCYSLGVSPLSFVLSYNNTNTQDLENQSDGFEQTMLMKNAKKEIAAVMTDDVRETILADIQNEIVNKEKKFEDFLLRQEVSMKLEYVKKRISMMNQLFARTFVTAHPKTLENSRNFPIEKARNSLNEVLQNFHEEHTSLMVFKPLFDYMIKIYTYDDQNISNFERQGKEWLSKISRNAAVISELCPGDSLTYVVGIVVSLKHFCQEQDPSFVLPLFINVMRDSRCRSLFDIIFGTALYAKKYPDIFSYFGEETCEIWNQVKEFLVTCLNKNIETLRQKFPDLNPMELIEYLK